MPCLNSTWSIVSGKTQIKSGKPLTTSCRITPVTLILTFRNETSQSLHPLYKTTL